MQSNKQGTESLPRKVVCVGTLVLKQHKLLFIRQAPGHSLAGKWSIPWGIVGESESPEDAALRETLEESGVAARIIGLIGIQNLKRPSWLALIFLCRHVSGRPTPDGIETDAAAYLSDKDMNSPNLAIDSWCKWIAMRTFRGQYTIIGPHVRNPYKPKMAFL